MSENNKITIKELFRAPPKIDLTINQSNPEPMVLFYIENRQLCVDASIVKEIIIDEPIRKITCTNSMALGITNYGGEIVPVFNLAKMYSGSTSPNLDQPRVAILQIRSHLLGIIADEVFYTADYNFTEASLESPDPTKYRHLQEYIEARGRLFMLLDPDALLAMITHAAS